MAAETWSPPFQYECPKGHYVMAEREVTRCPAVVKGTPCPGALVRVGPGSRGPRRNR